jgi:predicted aconitase with swiveling domain
VTMRSGLTVAPGAAEGELLALGESISLWGAVDRVTGRITAPTHPQHGQSITGRVLVMTSGRGSSSSSSVLAEMIRSGAAPAAIVMEQTDGILALGAIVADELYATQMPIVVVSPADRAALAAAARARIVARESRATITLVTAAGGLRPGA